MGKILRISRQLNFSPNTLGSYGLNRQDGNKPILLEKFRVS